MKVLSVYELVQRTVRANQTHLEPMSALEIALLINAATSLLRGRRAPFKQTKTDVESR